MISQVPRHSLVQSLSPADLAARRHAHAYTVTSSCPLCGGVLRLRQRRDHSLFVGCARYPHCAFSAPYEPIVEALKDQVERLQAELTLLQMQRTTATTAVQQGVGV
jgi:ssDNA-binding Zn-finger/Zn-ribbon topoisomerase 1